MSLFGSGTLETLKISATRCQEAEAQAGSEFENEYNQKANWVEKATKDDCDSRASRHNFITRRDGIGEWAPTICAVRSMQFFAEQMKEGGALASLATPNYAFYALRHFLKRESLVRLSALGQTDDTGVHGAEKFVAEVADLMSSVRHFTQVADRLQESCSSLFKRAHHIAEKLDKQFAIAMPSTDEHVKRQMAEVGRLLPLSSVTIEVDKPCVGCNKHAEPSTVMIELLVPKGDSSNACGHVWHESCAYKVLLRAYETGDTFGRCPSCNSVFTVNNMARFNVSRVVACVQGANGHVVAPCDAAVVQSAREEDSSSEAAEALESLRNSSNEGSVGEPEQERGSASREDSSHESSGDVVCVQQNQIDDKHPKEAEADGWLAMFATEPEECDVADAEKSGDGRWEHTFSQPVEESKTVCEDDSDAEEPKPVRAKRKRRREDDEYEPDSDDEDKDDHVIPRRPLSRMSGRPAKRMATRRTNRQKMLSRRY